MQREVTVEEMNTEILRREKEEAWNKGNLDVIDELVADDYVMHDPSQPTEIRGREGLKQYISAFRTAFPDMNMTVDDVVAEKNKVSRRMTLNGTHDGPLAGIPATGKRVSTGGIAIDRLENGKIVETFVNYDLMGLMRQIGAAPP